MEGIIPPSVQWRQSKGAYSPDFVSRLRREAPSIQEKLAFWEETPELYQTVRLEKIKYVMERLKTSDKMSIFNPEITAIAGMGLVACEYLQWFSENTIEKTNN
jgi:hypothetical protein